MIPTYHPLPPDKNPMFLEKRVYQGSNGRVYPLPFTDRISTDVVDHTWQAVHLENEFLRVMVLPEIGGRIHVGMDKTNGYDFFYRLVCRQPSATPDWCSAENSSGSRVNFSYEDGAAVRQIQPSSPDFAPSACRSDPLTRVFCAPNMAL